MLPLKRVVTEGDVDKRADALGLEEWEGVLEPRGDIDAEGVCATLRDTSPEALGGGVAEGLAEGRGDTLLLGVEDPSIDALLVHSGETEAREEALVLRLQLALPVKLREREGEPDAEELAVLSELAVPSASNGPIAEEEGLLVAEADRDDESVTETLRDGEGEAEGLRLPAALPLRNALPLTLPVELPEREGEPDADAQGVPT